MTKNYYDILGISKNATSKDIKKAYIKLSKEVHPDKVKNQDDYQKANDNFSKISEAYTILSDSEKRKIYDKYGAEGLEKFDQMGQAQGFPFADPMNFFNMGQQ